MLKVIKDITETYGFNMKGNIIALILEVLSDNRTNINVIVGAKSRRNTIGIITLFLQEILTNVMSIIHIMKRYIMNIIRIFEHILLQQMKRYIIVINKLKITHRNSVKTYGLNTRGNIIALISETVWDIEIKTALNITGNSAILCLENVMARNETNIMDNDNVI